MNGFRAHSKVQPHPSGVEALETHSSAIEWCPLCLGRLEWRLLETNQLVWRHDRGWVCRASLCQSEQHRIA